MQQGRIILEGMNWAANHWQRLINDFNQVHGLFSNSLRLGGDDGNRIANVTHLLINAYQDWPIWDDQAVAAFAGDIPSG